VAAVDQVWSVQGISDKLPDASENATAFLVGVFPSTAMQLLRRATGKVTGLLRGGLEPPFPLSQLDGMDIWTEARLLEVGVEDVQQLATANIVDLCLATRIPTQRLVDWIDEGILLLHAGMPRQDNVSDPTVRSTFRELREIGVRSATDVLALRATIGLRLDDRSSWPSADDPALGALVTGSASGPGLLTRVAVISTALQKQPNLPLVQNWLAAGSAERRSRFGRRNGVPAT
jgi:hypothetical protein